MDTQTGIKPQPQQLIPNLVHFAEAFVAAHGAGYPDGMAASLVAEENVRKMYARAGQRITERELKWVGAEVIMAYNRLCHSEERRRHSDWIAEYQAGFDSMRVG